METPPPVWGRPDGNIDENELKGNTPTCVGKTSAQLNEAAREEKHPHLCGEDLREQEIRNWTEETPPPVWGRLVSPRTSP